MARERVVAAAAPATMPRSVSTRPSLRPLRFCSASAVVELRFVDDLLLDEQLTEPDLLAALGLSSAALDLALLRQRRGRAPSAPCTSRSHSSSSTTTGRSSSTSSTVVLASRLLLNRLPSTGTLPRPRRLVVVALARFAHEAADHDDLAVARAHDAVGFADLAERERQIARGVAERHAFASGPSPR